VDSVQSLDSVHYAGQMLEWSYGYFDDRSGSEKLTQQC